MATHISLPKATAIDLWVEHVLWGKKDGGIAASLTEEVPPLLSWVVRGGCAVQCEHCIFPDEGPKMFGTRMEAEVLLNALRQLSGPGHLVQEGRQLPAWQVPILASASRRGHSVSLINNGQYATPSMLTLCEREGLSIDALDVSVDGPERIHNAQRKSSNAWRIAMKGMREARRILKPGGKLTSLFTLTSLNYAHAGETGEILTQLVDEWHVATMSLRPGIEHMRAGEREFATALEQLLPARLAKPTYLRSYSLSDFVSLLRILGKETARKALSSAMVIYNAIVLDIGLPFFFYPKSLQVNETLFVDADGMWRLPFSIQHSLAELQGGTGRDGTDLSHFSVAPMALGMDIPSFHKLAAREWWRAIGEESLSQERSALETFL